MLRFRLSALFVLASYLATVLFVPLLHRLHHEAYGDDHVHTASGTVYERRLPAPAPADEAAHHAAFDADLAALDLVDVAHAGVMLVDCELAGYTTASCAAGAATAHPHTFGDELLARAHRHSRSRPLDPRHGAGSVEHLGASLLATRAFLLPAPTQPFVAFRLELPYRSYRAPERITRTSRGPPLLHG